MSLGINLHGVVRGVVNALHPDAKGTLYRSTGQTTSADGKVKATYAEGVPVLVQVQSESPTELFHTDRVGQEEVSRKMYLFSAAGTDARVAGIVRELARNGDMLRMDEPGVPGVWWLITAVVEDFSRSGWCCVRATLQVKAPDFGGSGVLPATHAGEARPQRNVERIAGSRG